MKHIFQTSVVLLLTLSACGQQNDSINSDTLEEWHTYTDSDCEIQYPATWEENTTQKMGPRFILFSPIESDEDDFRENFNFLIQDLQGQAIDLDAYVSISENQVETLITNGEIITSERQTDENGESHKLIYYGKQGTYDLRFEQNFWIKNGEAFVLTFTSEKDAYEKYANVSKRIFNSFILQ
jgi:hypothetical protein